MYTPGQKCPTSGIYQATGPRGGLVDGKQIALSKGDTFPPAHGAGNVWQLIRATV